MLYRICLFYLLLISTVGMASKGDQIVRGRIIDNITHQPISGASISILDNCLPIGTTSDNDGNFHLAIPFGRTTLKIFHISYDNSVLPLSATGGKEIVLRVEMKERAEQLPQIEIDADRYLGNRTQEIGRMNFTVEEALRNAANFSDPARLVTQYAGISLFNDQGNNISVRGNSPNTVSWKLEGIDILNPNHLMNGGTINDRISPTGGGVNILSSQLLANSSFLTGPFSSEYGNSLSGIFDINFRRGNNIKREYTTQASLYGIDFAAEGPFTKANKSSYLVNYRYSTVALFGLMGIKFGDEDVKFQDLSVNLYFPTAKAGTFTFFGMGGLSSADFMTKRDSAEWLVDKDHSDILFFSNMLASGLTHEISLNKKTFMRTVIGFSALESERKGSILNLDYRPLLNEEDKTQQQKSSFTTMASHKINSKNILKVGGYFSRLYFYMRSTKSLLIDSATTLMGDGIYSLAQPYVNFEHRFSDALTMNAGLHSMYFTLNKSKSLEPRFSLNWRIGINQSLDFAYGLHSMLQQPQVYFMLFPETNGSNGSLNSTLDFTKSHQVALSYSRKVLKELKWITQVYYQYLYNVPIEDNSSSSFSALNVLDDWVTTPLANKGTGENYGLDMSIEKYLFSNYYFLISGSLYNSVYKGGDGVERSTRFNGNYASAITLGKERVKSKNEKNKIINTNLKILYRGGYRTTPINPVLSFVNGSTYYIQSSAFSNKMKDFFRIDFRFSVKRNKTNYTRTWAIDIQNILNYRNIAFEYYDVKQKMIISKYQNGLIPILSYRLDF